MINVILIQGVKIPAKNLKKILSRYPEIQKDSEPNLTLANKISGGNLDIYFAQDKNENSYLFIGKIWVISSDNNIAECNNFFVFNLLKKIEKRLQKFELWNEKIKKSFALYLILQNFPCYNKERSNKYEK